MAEENKTILATFEQGMVTDPIPNDQPDGTVRELLNGVYTGADYQGGAISNAPGTELKAKLNEGFILRGFRYIPARDKFIVFSYNAERNISEIGWVDLKQDSYIKLINDERFTNKLCFGLDEWIRIEYKKIEPCSQLWIYWSNNNQYRRFNVDDPQCSKDYPDFSLIKTACIPKPKIWVADKGGVDTTSGAYQFAFQLVDEDLNTTNISELTEPVSLGSANNRAGEISGESIYIELNNLDPDYHRVRIYLAKYTGGVLTTKMIKELPYNTNGVTYHYTGTTGQEETVPVEEILAKNNHWIEGKNLIQFNNRLILYNVTGQKNINYQPIVENVEVKYRIFRVPATEAHRYRNLMGDEVYALALVPKYIDNTFGAAIHLYGRDPEPGELDLVDDPNYPNCSDCEKPLWALKNTAKRTEVFCPGEEDLFSISDQNAERDSDWVYTPRRNEDSPFEDDNELLEDLRTANDNYQSVIEDVADQVGEDLDNVVAALEACNPCGSCSGAGGGGTFSCGDALIACALGLPDACIYFEVFCQGGSSGENCVDFNDGEVDVPDLPEDVDLDEVCVSCPNDCDTEYCDCVGDPGKERCVPKGTAGGSGASAEDPGDFYSVDRSNTDVYNESCKDGYCGDPSGVFARPCGPRGCGAPRVSGCRTGGCGSSSRGRATGCFQGVCVGGPPQVTSRFSDVDSSHSCEPIPIYDPDGCNVIGYEPMVYAEGKMGYWESKQTYPLTKDCEGNFIYGRRAGQPIRHHLTPDRTIEPHFMSFQRGVVTADTPGNYESNEGYVHLIGLSICKIAIPEKTEKPLCPYEPFVLAYVERNSANKSVIAKGLYIDTFQGNVFGEPHAFPKLGVNSLEYADRLLDYSNNLAGAEERIGNRNPDPQYIFHSPDTNILKPALVAHKSKVELEISGVGFRHGLYEKGMPTESWLLPATHQRAARQSIHLNRYSLPARVTSTFGDTDEDSESTCPDEITASINISTDAYDDFDTNGEPIVKYDVEISGTISPPPGATVEGTFIVPDFSGVDTVSVNITNNSFFAVVRGLDFLGNPQTQINDSLRVQLELLLIYEDCGCSYNQGNTITFISFEVAGPDSQNPNYTGTSSIVVRKVQDTCDGNEGGPGGDVTLEYEGSMVGCIKDISYAPANTVVDRGSNFSKSLMNIHRESSVFLELEQDSEKFTLRNNVDPYITDGSYNTQQPNSADATSDASFLGDVFNHDSKVHLASGWYGSLKRDMPSQYGRLERLQYIPLGLSMSKKNLLCGEISGVAGDTFVNSYSIKRTNYVSNLVGDDLIHADGFTQLLSEAKDRLAQPGGNRVLNMLRGIIRLVATLFIAMLGEEGKHQLGVDTCGVPPRSGDHRDPRNFAGLRIFGTGENSTTWDGNTSFQGRGQSGIESTGDGIGGGRRVYYPGVLNTLVTFWTESEVNTYYRETGETQEDNIYRNLKGQEIDSSLRPESGYKIGWLNRFYIELEEVIPWKKYVVLLINILVRIVYPIWGVITLIRIVGATPAIDGGFAPAVGFVLTLLVALALALITLAFLGFFWMVLLYFVDHMLYQMLGIHQCEADGSNRNLQDGKLRGFEDNYHFYNYDHSRKNVLNIFYGLGDPFYDCDCMGETINELIFSDPQILSSPIDSYRNFKINNFIKIPAHHGKILEIFIKGGSIFVRTSDGLFNLRGNDSTISLDGGISQAVLGSPDFISDPLELFGGIDEGYMGGNHPNASLNTRYGRFMIDDKAKEIYLFSESVAPFDIENNRTLIKQIVTLELTEQFPEYSIIDSKSPLSVGWSLGFDYHYGRLYISKTDYVPKADNLVLHSDKDKFLVKGSNRIVMLGNPEYFCNRSITVGIDMDTKRVATFSFTPLAYLSDRGNLYSTDLGNAFWKHLIKGNWNNFYGTRYPLIVDFIMNSPIYFKPKSLVFDAQGYIEVDGYRVKVGKTFNKAILYNSNESTGIKELVLKNPDNIQENISEGVVIPMVYSRGVYRMANFRSYSKDSLSPIFKKSCNLAFGDLVLNDQNISEEPQGDVLYDNSLRIRLIMDDYSDPNVSIKLRYALLTLDYHED